VLAALTRKKTLPHGGLLQAAWAGSQERFWKRELFWRDDNPQHDGAYNLLWPQPRRFRRDGARAISERVRRLFNPFAVRSRRFKPPAKWLWK